MAGKLDGKVAVVTGGSSGIGLAIAREFLAQGARVAIFARNRERLDTAAADLGGGCVAVRGDITSLADLDRLYEETQQALGKLDVLVANAGGGPNAPLAEMTEELFDAQMNITFKGTYFTVQRALPSLNDGASIVLISSGSNQNAPPGMSVYAASKAAVRSLARTFSRELLRRQIRVNALSPGLIETPSEGAGEINERFPDLIRAIPMRRVGQPAEMAKAALFLASDDSSYIAGTELVADGGFSQL